MNTKLVKVGVFWAVPDKIFGQSLLEVYKSYDFSAANSNGFIDYPYSHYEVWGNEISGLGDDCYEYPRGRVLYDTKNNRHRIFADECVLQSTIEEIVALFDIEEYEICRDEHYVCRFCGARELEYRILRGREKIGENLIEISYGKTKVLVELGKSLDGGDELFEEEILQTPYSAVVVSHYHEDHAGLIKHKRDCPVYIGKGAYRIIKATSEFRGETLPDNVETYANGCPFRIDEIKITPFLCDHSAFDSYMLLFEAGGKSILYTGDFRFHGRKDKEKLLSALPKSVDVLIHEGTNLGRNSCTMTEAKLEQKAVEIMRETEKPVFVLQSASNIDRLVSIYRASKRSGRILYMDHYLSLIASAAGGRIPRPDVFPDVIAFTPRAVTGKRKDTFFEIKNKRGLKGIANGTSRFTMLVRPTMCEYLKKLLSTANITTATLIYSTWNGYKKEEEMNFFLHELRAMGVEVVDLHTSGHASSEDVELLKETVHAKSTDCVHTAKVKKDLSLQPKFDVPSGFTSDSFLEKLTFDGLKQRYGDVLPEQVVARAQSELDIIRGKNCVDYYLIIQDIVGWAKATGIPVGPGRGAQTGSIVSYAIGITEIDPLQYGLIFERFLNPYRDSMPDFDIDVGYGYRDEVVDYIKNKYADRFAFIAAYPKKRRKDAVPKMRVNAAYVAISGKPIKDYLPLRYIDGEPVLPYTADELSEMGMIHPAIISLYALTAVKNCTELIRKNHGVAIDLSEIDYADENVFSLITDGDTDGVFQLASSKMQFTMQIARAKRLEDLTTAIALNRPDTEIREWLCRRNRGCEPIPYDEVSERRILANTYGIIVYQEQIIQLLHELAGFSLGESELIYLAMKKGDEPYLTAMKEKFISGGKSETDGSEIRGCLKNGIPADAAEKIFHRLTLAAHSAFMKAHAAPYATIAYQMAWLKTYYREEFDASVKDCNFQSGLLK